MTKKLNKNEDISSTAAKKKIEKNFETLIFIDTNIFLDFYRIRNNVSIKYLNEIIDHEELIITSNQVEMEFKKNRQSAIRESIFETAKKPVIGISYPAIVSDHESLEKIKNSKKDIEIEQSKIKETIEQILKKPNEYDRVYISLEKIFKTSRKINLSRNDERRFEIRDLASKRFTLGYPPRKKDDNSIGDAINWEWIINCAIGEDKNIIIVTRDGDYGTIDKENCYLNDWLLEEFKDRVGDKKNIRLTDKLSEAFKWVKIPVTSDMIEEEQKIINMNNAWDYMNARRMQEDVSNVRNLINNSSWDSFLIDRMSKDQLPSWTERLNMERLPVNENLLDFLSHPLRDKPLSRSDHKKE
ncbi:PIN domain-containing protein [Chryseobacterium phosphatilyticum]|uniref:PIN domain-containing protein n=1 Tax=Chryseobacterium phosphatilyticum TaxID=475075 RepID=UPI00140392EA|nr:PIN domain-containing protein [Chryseobacterium phosphatilyticum]